MPAEYPEYILAMWLDCHFGSESFLALKRSESTLFCFNTDWKKLRN